MQRGGAVAVAMTGSQPVGALPRQFARIALADELRRDRKTFDVVLLEGLHTPQLSNASPHAPRMKAARPNSARSATAPFLRFRRVSRTATDLHT